MAVLEDVKVLQNIALNDSSKDNLINLYIRKAVTLINIYLNIKPSTPTIDIQATYPDAVVEYVIICLNKLGNEGLKQFTQGSISGTYVNELPDSVIALLPAPYAKLLQTTPVPTGVVLP